MTKNELLIILFLLISGLNTLSAQEDTGVVAGSQQTDSITQPLIIDINQPEGFNFWDERFKGNWAGIFLSVNGFDRADYSMYTNDRQGFLKPKFWKSNGLSINIIQISKRLQRNRNFIGLVTGVGMDIQSYSLDQNYSLQKGDKRIEPVRLSFEQNQKSKFASTYLSVPLLIEFQVPVANYSNRLYFSAGVIGSLRLNTHTKVKYRSNNKKQKLKESGNFNLNDFRFAGTVRLGYRWVNLFATYDLQPLFKDDKGPVLYPFSVGLALITF